MCGDLFEELLWTDMGCFNGRHLAKGRMQDRDCVVALRKRCADFSRGNLYLKWRRGRMGTIQ